jgi:hypothetical protein
MNTSFPRFHGRLALPIVVSATAAILLIGCLNPETGGAGTGPDGTQDRSSADGLAVLESRGFARDRIVEMKDGFVVEDDMFFTKEGLAAVSLNSPKALAKTSQRAQRAVNTPAPHKLRLAIHSSLGINATWRNAVYQAVNNLNNLKTRLHIDVVPTGSGDITLYSDESPSCPASLSHLPSNVSGRALTFLTGEVGYAACINMEHPALGPIGGKVSTLTHEIAHTVALEHTDGSRGSVIAGTPDGDASSVMNSSSGGVGILSRYDIVAFETLYPSNKPLGGSNLDGDTKDDIVFYRPSDGYWAIEQSSTNFTSSLWRQWGERGDMPMEDMDIDGDSKDDLVVWRPRDGYWHIIHSRDNSYRGIQFGGLGDVAISNSDTDGDGKDDLVLFRWSTGQFFVCRSGNNYVGYVTINFGQAGDMPVGGVDVNKDRKDDIVFYRPSETRFYSIPSVNNFSNYFTYNVMGQAGDIPVGNIDIDRDGWDDLVVWSPGTGNWISLNSGVNMGYGFTKQFGQRGDVPMSGTDLDQDGLRDIIVWRPSEAIWYVLTSGSLFSNWRWWGWG